MSKINEKNYQVASSKGNNGQILTLSGDLSLNCIKGIKDELSNYVNIDSIVKVVVNDVTNIDLGFLQLIQSFAWTLLKNNKQVDVELNLLPEQQKLLQNAGIKLKF